jgi:hypothetical protein
LSPADRPEVDMADKPDFDATFAELKSFIKTYEPRLIVLSDEPGKYYLSGGFSPKFKREIWFGGVEIKKNYVSYHLIPIYMHPDLLAGISDGLKARKTGKSCFNFKKVDPAIFGQLAELTRQSFERFAADGLITSS